MAESICLLPLPQRLERRSGELRLPLRGTIRLLGPAPYLWAAARTIQGAAVREAGHILELAAGAGITGDTVTIDVEPGMPDMGPEGYGLSITPQRVLLVGKDAAGAFYGAQTLAQLIRQFPEGLPCLEIRDWPDFPARGVMLDISRDKVPTLETLYGLVDLLAGWKINQLQLYTEHTFAYRAHPEVWAEASPLTGEDILLLDRYCRDRFVELVPNQNSFGHMERWLKLPEYRHLAEAPNGFDFPWGGHSSGPFSLCPEDPGSLELLRGLYDELLPYFTSGQLNVGCDETFDLGAGRSKQACEARGTERVYLDFLLGIYREVKARGRTMQFWGDIILHRPDLIPELPKDTVALEWGYEADHPFAKDGAMFRDAGVPFYVCPGTSSWNTIAGRTDNTIGNIGNAAENGLASGAIGLLNTDWGDNGHLQYLPASYLGFAVGAARSWACAANATLPVAEALCLYAYRDRAGVMGRVAYDLGNVYQACGKLVGNASALFHLLLWGGQQPDVLDGITADGLDAAEAAIDAAMRPLPSARMERPDAALIAEEFANAAAMLRLGCRLGRFAMGSETESGMEVGAELRRVIGEHERLWLARNRPGGLHDSAARLRRQWDRLRDGGQA